MLCRPSTTVHSVLFGTDAKGPCGRPPQRLDPRASACFRLVFATRRARPRRASRGMKTGAASEHAAVGTLFICRAFWRARKARSCGASGPGFVVPQPSLHHVEVDMPSRADEGDTLASGHHSQRSAPDGKRVHTDAGLRQVTVIPAAEGCDGRSARGSRA